MFTTAILRYRWQQPRTAYTR